MTDPGSPKTYGSGSTTLIRRSPPLSAGLEEEGKEAGLRGSPLYMAPEIILKRTYDAKESDDRLIAFDCCSSKFKQVLRIRIRDPELVFSGSRISDPGSQTHT